MEQNELENLIKAELDVFLQGGFTYEFTYDKSTDTSCVYIHRFKRGSEVVEIRTVTSGKNIKLVINRGGSYQFPNLTARYQKEANAFKFSHIFKKATEEEQWKFFLSLMKKECEKGEFFGIKLT